MLGVKLTMKKLVRQQPVRYLLQYFFELPRVLRLEEFSAKHTKAIKSKEVKYTHTLLNFWYYISNRKQCRLAKTLIYMSDSAVVFWRLKIKNPYLSVLRLRAIKFLFEDVISFYYCCNVYGVTHGLYIPLLHR